MFNGYRVSVAKDEKMLYTDGDDGCTIMWMYLMLQNCTPKMVKTVHFMLRIFYHNFFKKGQKGADYYNIPKNHRAKNKFFQLF